MQRTAGAFSFLVISKVGNTIFIYMKFNASVMINTVWGGLQKNTSQSEGVGGSNRINRFKVTPQLWTIESQNKDS